MKMSGFEKKKKYLNIFFETYAWNTPKLMKYTGKTALMFLAIFS